MKKTPLTLLLALCSALSVAQSPLADSLRREYQKSKAPLQQIELYYALAREVQMQDLDLSFAYADTLEKMAKAAKFLLGEAYALHIRGNTYQDKKEKAAAIRTFKKQLEIGKKTNDQ